jgi:serine protease
MRRAALFAAATGLMAVAVVPAAATGTTNTTARSSQAAAVASALHVAMMPRPGDPITPPAVRLPAYVPRPVYGTPWPGNMPYYGGRVALKPRLYVVFWGWHARKTAYADTLLAFFRGVGGSPWLGVTTQYYQNRPDGSRAYVTNPKHQLDGWWYDQQPPPANHYAEGLIAGEAVRAAKHFHVLGDDNAVVLVASPQGRNPAGFVDRGYCAWHAWTRGIAYINLPYLLDTNGGCGSGFVNADARGVYDGVSMVAGHEYSEVITDPGIGNAGPGAGWVDMGGQENADKCEWIQAGRPGGALDIVLPTGRFAVQQTWSNAALSGVGDCAAS